jgi:hypothetical protein
MCMGAREEEFKAHPKGAPMSLTGAHQCAPVGLTGARKSMPVKQTGVH